MYTHTYIYTHIMNPAKEATPKSKVHLGSQWRSVFEEGSLRGEIAGIQETRVKKTPHHPLVWDIP